MRQRISTITNKIDKTQAPTNEQVARYKSTDKQVSDTTQEIGATHKDTSDLSECSKRSEKNNIREQETAKLATDPAVAAWREILR